MERNKKKRTRSQVLRMLLLQRLDNEKLLLFLLLLALSYSMASNIISNCCPIVCSPNLAIIGNALNDVAKNICYSIIAGILFYFVNSIYSDVYKNVDKYNAMSNSLILLQFDSKTLVQLLTDDHYDKNMNQVDLFKSIMRYLCNKDDDYHQIGRCRIIHHIPIDRFDLLINKWEETNEKRKEFLDNYGELLNKEEKSTLRSYWYDLTTRRIIEISKLAVKPDLQYVDFYEIDLARIVNMIVSYKMFLTELAKKYVKYTFKIIYLDRPYIEEDIS